MNLQINEVIRNWVNLRTLSYDGWTALHLACRQSNKMFLYLVEELGADLAVKNQGGIDLMHKAAYDDNTYVITYLHEKAGFGVSSLDKRQNTPLHYACDHKTDFSANWLIGFGADINAVNEDGDTPLHLLIQNVQKLDSSKLVKELICKGADRDAQNLEGKKPIDILREECSQHEKNGDRVISNKLRLELEEALGPQPYYVPCFHVKQPLMKLERSFVTMTFYISVMVGTYALLWYYLFPYANKKLHVYPLTVLFALQFIAFAVAAIRDPGEIEPSSKISFLKLN